MPNEPKEVDVLADVVVDTLVLSVAKIENRSTSSWSGGSRSHKG